MKFVKRAACALLSLVMLGGVFAGCTGAPSGEEPVPPSGEEPAPPSGEDPVGELFEPEMNNTTKVGMSAEYLGTVPRTLPEVSDGGLGRYPVYGGNNSFTQEEREAIIAENNALVSSSSTYDAMDAEGNLSLNGIPTGKKLYKHSAAAGMYEGDVADDEPALVKRLTYRSRSRGNLITGLYAPAGEVLKIEMSARDLAASGGVKVFIGQALAVPRGGSQSNNIWAARQLDRMPVILNTMTVSEQVGYVGAYLGGPVYVQPVRAGAEFTVTVSGAVAYSHYVWGYTTREEFERNSRSSAPYFDLEVWDDGVRHSGPKARVEQFGYDDLTAAAVFWDKVSLVSNRVPAGSSGDLGITFLYDPFVAAGSMVAFVGNHTVNCPLSCFSAALDIRSAVDDASDSFWGVIHEYNHHYQRFGFAPGDEVTNNAVSLVEYSLFTRISAGRKLGSAAEGSYSTGWNRYTNPSWSLRQTLANAGTNSNLDSYANLLHAFGQDAFIRAAQNGNGQGGADAWYRAVSDATQYDMTYYFTGLLHQTVSAGVLSEYAAKDLPVFVPVASIYQTGRSYLSDGKICYSRTAEPYGIEAGKPFELDFNENIVAPQGVTVTVKSVTQPENGTLEKLREGVYRYTPGAGHRDSGRIYVTLGIVKDDGAFEAEDVTLVVELRQEQYKPDVLERTVYTYTAENMYRDVEEAVSNNFAGYESVKKEDNENRVQNGNAEIWEPSPGQNAVMVVEGKFRIPSDGKYRVALRGRRQAALYLSTDGGKSYERAARLDNQTNSPDFDFTNEEHYCDRMFSGGQWVRFRAVLLVTYGGSFIGVGLGRFSGENVRVSYLNAYRNAYEYEPFSSDYFYGRAYSYDYHDDGGAEQSLVGTNYRPWDASYDIGNLFDDDPENFIHSDQSSFITESSPFELTVDLGRTVRANTFTIYGEPSRQYQPKDFVLYGGTAADALEVIAEVEDGARTGNNVVVSFAERDLRYYKLVVTDTHAVGRKYIAFRRAEVSFAVPGGTLVSPDDARLVYRGAWELSQALSTFGHAYLGTDAELSFEFTGTRFAVRSAAGAPCAFEVYIDGRKVGAAAQSASGAGAVSYLSEALPQGAHTVVLRGDISADSLVFWD